MKVNYTLSAGTKIGPNPLRTAEEWYNMCMSEGGLLRGIAKGTVLLEDRSSVGSIKSNNNAMGIFMSAARTVAIDILTARTLRSDDFTNALLAAAEVAEANSKVCGPGSLSKSYSEYSEYLRALSVVPKTQTDEIMEQFVGLDLPRNRIRL